MRLVILTQYFPPEVGAPQNRLGDLAERLAARGHSIQVVTAVPNYPSNSVYSGYKEKRTYIEENGQFRIIRVPLFVPTEKTFLKRLACYTTFAWNAARAGRHLAQFDVLLAESPPLFTPAAAVYLAHRFNAKLISNVSDLWPESAVALGFLRSPILIGVARRLEKWIYESSDLITAQTVHIVGAIAQHEGDSRVALFPNGVDLTRYAPLSTTECQGVRRHFGWADTEFIAAYTGVLGHAQALDQVLDATKILRERALPFRAVFFGDGPCREHLQRRIEREQLAKCATIYGTLDSKKIASVQFAVDAGLVPLSKAALFNGARPSKMFEFMAAAKPIVLCGRGESEAILNSATGGPAGLSVPPEQPEALADALLGLATDRPSAALMGQRGRTLVETSFDREVITRNLEQLITRTLLTEAPSKGPM